MKSRSARTTWEKSAPFRDQTLAQIRLRKGMVDSGIQPIEPLPGCCAARAPLTQADRVNARNPLSIIVGTVGTARDRWRKRTARIFSLPALTSGRAAGKRREVEVDLPVDDGPQGRGSAVAGNVDQAGRAAQAKQLGAELTCGTRPP